MQPNYIKRLFWVLVPVSVMAVSCKKYLNVGNPPDFIVANSAYGDNLSASMVLAGDYVQISQGGYAQGGSSISVSCAKAADEFAPHSLQTDPFFLNTAMGDNFWPLLYQTVYDANNTIQGLEGSSSAQLTSDVKTELVGEAKFLRAFSYFYLTSLYGDVPVLLTPAYFTNATTPRTSQADVYAQIITDLKDAQTALSQSFVNVGVNGMAPSTERTRPNKWAATALLARVYLYAGDYPDAITQAGSVIGQTSMFSLCNDLDSVFLMNNQEAIWQIQPANPTASPANVGDAMSYIGTNWMTGQLQGNIWLSQGLLNAFEPGDQRKMHWVGQATDSSGDYFPYKYKQFTYNAPQSEYIMVFRLAEQYLIRADAEARSGQNTEALSDLNVIRTRAGLAPLTDTTADVQAAVLQERRVELFTEWGQRWFDLKRTGEIDTVMQATALYKGTAWESYRDIFGIPVADLKTDGNLTQNQGYPSR